MSTERILTRRRNYKPAIRPEEGRRRREDQIVQIRKRRRDKLLLDSRMHWCLEYTKPPTPVVVELKDLPSMVSGVSSNNVDLQLAAIRQIRKLLLDDPPPVLEVIQSGVVPRLVELLMSKDSPDIQFEAVWALTNIAFESLDYTRLVIDHGAVPVFVKLLDSPYGEVCQGALWALGIVASGTSDHIWVVMAYGVVPILLSLLDYQDDDVRILALWALGNFASGTSDQTRVVIEYGAVPIFVKLLSSPCASVREQAVRALGNVAADSPYCRDIVLGHGALVPLLSQFDENYSYSLRKMASWTLSNFFMLKPQPTFEQVSPAFPALQKLLLSRHSEILENACWALSYLTDGANDKIQALIEAGVCPCLVQLLWFPHITELITTEGRDSDLDSEFLLIPALRAVGNFLTADDLQTQYMIDCKVLFPLRRFLPDSQRSWDFYLRESFKEEACWIVSNITAGNKDQIQAVIDAHLIPRVVFQLKTASFKIKKEAAWAISNATSGGTHKQINYLVSQGCIRPLCDLLECADPRFITLCLEVLDNILKVGEAVKKLCQSDDLLDDADSVEFAAAIIDEAGGLEKIQNLQSHENNNIYEKAAEMLETYWSDDVEWQPALVDVQFQVPYGGFNFC